MDTGAGAFRAFLLSDIRGYSSFAAARGDEAAAALTGRFIALAEDVIGGLGGESIGNRGDEVLFAFGSPRQAIRAAVAFQSALLEATREEPGLPLPAGVGIDVGEAVKVPDGWRANAINVAARLCSIAQGGEILATREVAHLAQAVDGVRYQPRPATRVKGLAEPVNLVRVCDEAEDTARALASIGFTHAERPPGKQARRPKHRPVIVVAGAALAAAIAAVVLASIGPSSVTLAAGDVGAIATDTGSIVEAQRLEGAPSAVAVSGDGSVWVVSATAGTLSRIDPRSRTVTQIAVGRDPVAVTVAADNSVWVANSGDGTVSRVSPQNNQIVATVRVGAGPSALVAAGDSVWVANTLAASVSKIDVAGDAVVATAPVGSEPAGIAAGGGSIWVADEGDRTVYRLDPRTGAQVVAPIEVGNGPLGAAFGDGAAWVVNSIDGTLSRIDAQTNTVTAVPVGQGPYGVAVGGRRVWVSDQYGNDIAAVDPVRMTVVGRTRTASAPLGLSLAGRRLWVATDGIGAVAHRGGVLYAVGTGIDGPQGDPAQFDAGAAYSAGTWRIVVLTSDGLVGYRRTGGIAGGTLVPDLAVSLPVPADHGRTYTFRLRSGVRYSNGMPLRASDIVRGLTRAFKLRIGPLIYFSPIAGGQRCLQMPDRCDLSHGVVADDAAGTVTFHLTRADPDFLPQLTLPVAFPIPAGTPAGLQTRGIPGTGPYVITSYAPGTPAHPHGRLVLARNRYFRQWSAAAQPSGFPDQIVITTGYGERQELAAVEQGRADVAWDAAPPQAVPSLASEYPAQLHHSVAAGTGYLWLNARKPPFDNVLARRALNFAVDRAALARASPHSFADGQVTCQLLPPTVPGYAPDCPYTLAPSGSGRWLSPDLGAARRLVTQSGTAGARVSVVEPSSVSASFNQSLGRALAAIGYRPRFVGLPLGEFYSLSPPEIGRRYQVGVTNWAADYVAPSNFLFLLVACNQAAGGTNPGQYCDPGLDRQIASATAEQAAQAGAAARAWTAIDRRVVEAAVDVPIDNPVREDFLARRVGNYQFNPQWGMLLDELWVR